MENAHLTQPKYWDTKRQEEVRGKRKNRRVHFMYLKSKWSHCPSSNLWGKIPLLFWLVDQASLLSMSIFWFFEFSLNFLTNPHRISALSMTITKESTSFSPFLCLYSYGFFHYFYSPKMLMACGIIWWRSVDTKIRVDRLRKLQGPWPLFFGRMMLIITNMIFFHVLLFLLLWSEHKWETLIPLFILPGWRVILLPCL